MQEEPNELAGSTERGESLRLYPLTRLRFRYPQLVLAAVLYGEERQNELFVAVLEQERLHVDQAFRVEFDALALLLQFELLDHFRPHVCLEGIQEGPSEVGEREEFSDLSL